MNFFSGPGSRPPPFPTSIPRDVVLLFEKLAFEVRAVWATVANNIASTASTTPIHKPPTCDTCKAPNMLMRTLPRIRMT